jgi:hypothetical protein
LARRRWFAFSVRPRQDPLGLSLFNRWKKKEE